MGKRACKSEWMEPLTSDAIEKAESSVHDEGLDDLPCFGGVLQGLFATRTGKGIPVAQWNGWRGVEVTT